MTSHGASSPATRRTEVGRLGLALNAMLAQIERAFAERQASEDRLRRFLADASHELRTPLASIRGYAELLRIGAASSPADTEKATSRIEQEAARMGVLVEDLLTLARLDELRELQRAPVDLALVASDAVDDARATEPDRPITLDAPAPAMVLGDPHELRQVLADLVRNALVHTGPGTAIEVRAGRRGGEATLEVGTTAPACPVTTPRPCSSASGGPTRVVAAGGPERASASPSSPPWWPPTEVGPRPRNAPGGGARFVVRLPAHDGVPADAAPVQTAA